jgi:hypothetical protein
MSRQTAQTRHQIDHEQAHQHRPSDKQIANLPLYGFAAMIVAVTVSILLPVGRNSADRSEARVLEYGVRGVELYQQRHQHLQHKTFEFEAGQLWIVIDEQASGKGICGRGTNSR